jgi:hypothetical protein
MRRAALLVAAGILIRAGAASAQAQVGHKVLGTLGADAGVQPPPGGYAFNQTLWYAADRFVDRNGDTVPIPGLNIDAIGNAVGASGTFQIPHFGYWTASIAVPAAHFHLGTDDPRASLDEFGLADLYVEPVRLGWRFDRFDVVASYAFYAPTGRFQPKGLAGIGNGYWTNEFSAGGAVWLDRSRGWRASALASYDLNGRKTDVDITRGATVQIQGGTGLRLFWTLEAGVAGYALWQVTDDKGTDLPAVLRGLRERTFGVGPELGLAIPQIRARVDARYEWDFLVRSRPVGRILAVSVGFAFWQPRPPSS